MGRGARCAMKKDASLEAGATRATAKIKSESRSLVVRCGGLARDDNSGGVSLPIEPGQVPAGDT